MKKIAAIVFIAVALALVLSCSGTDAPTATVTYALGDTGPAGGLIFYIDVADDYTWTYLEASADDLNSGAAIAVSDISTYITGTSTAVGTGQANTTAITAVSTTGAAELCAAYSVGSTDWFLPSSEELHLLYSYVSANGTAGFTQTKYMSSSEFSTPGIRIVYFAAADSQVAGAIFDGAMANTAFVRAVRSF